MYEISLHMKFADTLLHSTLGLCAPVCGTILVHARLQDE